jgi:hypothetical protein
MNVKRTAWSLVGMLVVTASVSAQTPPPLVRFAGVVPASAGAVPGGPATLTFALYPEQQGGTPLWTETQTVTLDAEGRYAVVLGATQPAGLPLDVFTSGEAQWLGVTVAQGTEAPRVLLVSVPYALKAADATTVAGKPLSAFVLAGEKTGTGADGLTYVNTQALKNGLQTADTPGQTGNAGTANYLGVFTDATDLGNSALYENGTWIGLGMTTPMAPLHVVAAQAPAAFFDVYSPVLTALPVVYRAARGTPTSPSAVQTGDILGGVAVRGFGSSVFSPSGRGQVMFKAAENWTDSAHGTYLSITTTPTGATMCAERLRVTAAGNVGIGTTTPGQLLSVAGTIESTSGGFKFPDGTLQASAARSSAGNDAFGTLSLQNNTSGQWNAAFGDHTLSTNTTGSYNTAIGYSALASNSTSNGNTAVGYSALTANTTGYYNTVTGTSALFANTIGYYNTATGASALYANSTGYANTATGTDAMYSNGTGFGNTAAGYQALYLNATGWSNTASGQLALNKNTTGYENTASGVQALYSNTTGYENTASGLWALYSNTTGNSNIAIGVNAGYYLTSGNNNIEIGNLAFAAEDSTIRIGTPGTQTRTFVAGIRGVTTWTADAVAVVIDSNGQLGTVNSSRHYKDDIADMAGASSGLMKLRPVTFHYKSDQNPAGRTLQYGLIAEEVAEVYPGLVTHSRDGQIESVMYQFLPPMLLNEFQKQQRTIETQQQAIETLQAQVEALTRAVAALSDRKQ